MKALVIFLCLAHVFGLNGPFALLSARISTKDNPFVGVVKSKPKPAPQPLAVSPPPPPQSPNKEEHTDTHTASTVSTTNTATTTANNPPPPVTPAKPEEGPVKPVNLNSETFTTTTSTAEATAAPTTQTKEGDGTPKDTTATTTSATTTTTTTEHEGNKTETTPVTAGDGDKNKHHPAQILQKLEDLKSRVEKLEQAGSPKSANGNEKGHGGGPGSHGSSSGGTGNAPGVSYEGETVMTANGPVAKVYDPNAGGLPHPGQIIGVSPFGVARPLVGIGAPDPNNKRKYDAIDVGKALNTDHKDTVVGRGVAEVADQAHKDFLDENTEEFERIMAWLQQQQQISPHQQPPKLLLEMLKDRIMDQEAKVRSQMEMGSASIIASSIVQAPIVQTPIVQAPVSLGKPGLTVVD